MDDERLRRELVERLERNRVLRDSRVKAAVLRVPRHRFLPDVSLDAAYEDRAIAIKESEGSVLSSISQPSMIVQMLELLEVNDGNTVLEIGTGSGYNAALLAELAGRTGVVVTVDIEDDLVEAARARLSDLHYSNVTVANASTLESTAVPFDRTIVTARADDIEPDWWRLLKDGGRIVVPLDIGYGHERAVGFVREGDILQSVGSYACAFIGMRTHKEPDGGQVFFPNRRARYNAPGVRPRSIVAIERSRANAELFEDADVIVARPNTIFALEL